MNEIIEIPPVVSHQYLISGANGYLLIDTGLPNNFEHLKTFLKKNKLSFADIEMIVITHADGDHFGCLAKIQKEFPLLVSASSELEAEAIRDGKSSRELKRNNPFTQILTSLISPLFSTEVSRIERILTIGEELPYLGGLEIIDSIGHTPGHISLWSKSTRTLFSGDSIRVNHNKLSPSSGDNTWDEDLAKISFEKQLSLQPDRIYGGHGTWHRL
jgi:glyoxylase-like metal-dependent hydrolase (beta-lactamase superfamily II)